MVDNLKKKGKDSEHIALTQKHERAYLREQANKLMDLAQKEDDYSIKQEVRRTIAFEGTMQIISCRTVIKLCKALIKLLDRYERGY